jgi:hypothetical protein
MNGPLTFADTLIICDGYSSARLGCSIEACIYTDERRKTLWIGGFQSYHDGQATKAEQERLAA